MTTSPDLLPPASTPLEHAFGTAIARISDVPTDLSSLWNPQTCPIQLLPWLAWSLSIDQWDSDWTEEKKRGAVAGAIAAQRYKGTRASVEGVLASFDELLRVVEWFEEGGSGEPHTFTVYQPAVDGAGVAGGDRMSAAVGRAIAKEVARTKPVRAHFELVRELTLAGSAGPVGAVSATGYRRLDLATAEIDDTPWDDLLQDENGEPLSDDFDTFIDGTAP